MFESVSATRGLVCRLVHLSAKAQGSWARDASTWTAQLAASCYVQATVQPAVPVFPVAHPARTLSTILSPRHQTASSTSGFPAAANVTSRGHWATASFRSIGATASCRLRGCTRAASAPTRVAGMRTCPVSPPRSRALPRTGSGRLCLGMAATHDGMSLLDVCLALGSQVELPPQLEVSPRCHPLYFFVTRGKPEVTRSRSNRRAIRPRAGTEVLR
jgi:hypothetical protein